MKLLIFPSKVCLYIISLVTKRRNCTFFYKGCISTQVTGNFIVPSQAEQTNHVRSIIIHRLMAIHYENLPMQYTEIFKVVK